MCHHKTPDFLSPCMDRVQNRGPWHAPMGKLVGDPELSRAGQTSGSEEAMTASPALYDHWLRRRTNMGVLITMLLSTVNWTDMGDQEWRNALFIRSIINPSDLPPHCYGCNTKFSIWHALDCNNGGLVKTCHKDLCDGVSDLSGKAFTPPHMFNKPLIHPGHVLQKGKYQPAGYSQNNSPVARNNSEQKRNFLTRNLWHIWTDSIHAMHVGNTDTLSNRNMLPENFLQTAYN